MRITVLVFEKNPFAKVFDKPILKRQHIVFLKKESYIEEYIDQMTDSNGEHYKRVKSNPEYDYISAKGALKIEIK